VSKVTLYRYIGYMRRWVRSTKGVGAAILTSIPEDLKTGALILPVYLALLIALPLVLYHMDLPRKMLDVLQVSAQIASAAATILLVFIAIKRLERSLERLRTKRPRKSFKATQTDI